MLENAAKNTDIYMQKSLKLFGEKKLQEMKIKEQDFRIKQLEKSMESMKDPQKTIKDFKQ